VVDGVTEAMTLQGLNLNDNGDVAKFYAPYRVLASEGPAIEYLDHVTKDRETRGRYALGAGHKLAGVDVAYSVELREPFGRGRSGLARIDVMKDRPGFVRQAGISSSRAIAEFSMTSNPDGSMDAELRPPPTGAFRPTVLMGRVAEYLATCGSEPSQAEILRTVRGKRDGLILALECLVEEGYVARRMDGAGHASSPRPPVRRGRMIPHRSPVPRPFPDRSGGTAETTVPPFPPPYYKGGERGTAQWFASQPATVPPEGRASLT
jgi:hypothetical protein